MVDYIRFRESYKPIGLEFHGHIILKKFENTGSASRGPLRESSMLKLIVWALIPVKYLDCIIPSVNVS